MEEKTCSKCKESKLRDKFRSRIGPKVNKNGLSPTCRECERRAKREYDLKKKINNPLKMCKICKIEKHLSTFPHNDPKGPRCSKCREKIKRDKIEETNKKKFERLIQHQNGNKRCFKCRLFKPFEQFWKSKDTNDGFYSSCIDCTKKSQSKFKERQRKNQRDWRLNNLEWSKEYARNWDKNRRKVDSAYRLRRNVMHAISASMRGSQFENIKTKKLKKAIFDHLPYTVDQLKYHLESLWEPWMNWNNHGRYDKNIKTWQVDHIFPQSKLPYSDMNDDNFKKCWALDNLQPLETLANIKKSNRI